MSSRPQLLHRLSVIALLLAACGGDQASRAVTTSSARPATDRPTDEGRSGSTRFPTELFTALGDEPVSNELATELQAVLDRMSDGHGIAATLITPQGSWSGATGFATTDRRMQPDDQMSIASITKTVVAAQVMQLVEHGELTLDDFAADRLPPDVSFDTNGARIVDLLSMRSGLPEYLADEAEFKSALFADPRRVWTQEEMLATVGPERGPVGGTWEYIGTNYLLLGLIIEHATGRPIADVLRHGVLSGDNYSRLIYQPADQPTDPMAMPLGASADTFDLNGGYLPSMSYVTMFSAEGAMASDSLTLARWFRALCAGEVVSSSALDEMTDFETRPEYGLGIWDRRDEYGSDSAALGHTGRARGGYRSAALCFQQPTVVIVVLANSDEHDVDATAGRLVRVFED